ncbi:hypothetical protein HPB51_023193 [Rhipicephalus microplus]|uniref:Uncharacterized protein n=1 Tax=Rhipicephalus microplus TaxID=6941 RepID=A0A9J6DKC0_RHIMP|nr:hypothetical protein HPB51_023193 [Rhipicephalus microplus]
MLPGYFRSGTRVNLATIVSSGEPTVPRFLESWASRRQRKALSSPAISETSSTPKGWSTLVPSVRSHSFELRSAVRSSVSLPVTTSPPTRTQRDDRFTTTTSPTVRIGTKSLEATVLPDVRSSRDSTNRYATIPAMTIQSGITGNRVTPVTKPAISTRETLVHRTARHSDFDDRTLAPWMKSSVVPTPSSAAGTTVEVSGSHSIETSERTAAVTNTVTNGVIGSTSSPGDNANTTTTGKTEERQPLLTNVAASARPGSAFNFANDTVAVSDADKEIAESESNGDLSFTRSTMAVGVTVASTHNGKESGGIDANARNFQLGEPSSEAPAVTMASPLRPSENRTYPALRINSALNANASPITTDGKGPVVDFANAASSGVKYVTAWRIRAASTRHSVSMTASTVGASDDAKPRSSTQDASAAIFPAMIIQSAITSNGATATPTPAIRVAVHSFGVKAPPTGLNNSGVGTFAHAAGTRSFTSAFEARRFRQDEVNATDKIIRPALHIRPALTTHPMQVIARSSAAFHRSIPGGYTRTPRPAARRFPAMLVQAASKGTGVSEQTKPATDIHKTLVYNLADINDADTNPIRSARARRITIVDNSYAPSVKAVHENPRHIEERSSKTAPAWRIIDPIRMDNPSPAIHSRPVNNTSTSGRV